MPIALGVGAQRRAPVADAPSPTVPRPVPSQIEDAWESYKASGSLASRNRLVSYYMRVHVRPIASRIHAGLPHQVELEDLVQQGYLGLIDAMDRFDLARETRFETFSRRRVFGSIQDYLRSIDPVPRLTRMRAKRYRAACERFRKEHGRDPADDELRPLVDAPEAVFRRWAAGVRPPIQVPFSHLHPDSSSDADEDGDAMRGFEDHRETGPVRTAERRDLQRWLIRGLDARDRLIIVLYYFEQMTMLEIGGTIGISESRVSQRLESILQCLRSRLVATGAEREFE